MKKAVTFLILFVALAAQATSQEITSTREILLDTISPITIIKKFKQTIDFNVKEVVSETFTIREPLPLKSHTSQDSLNLQFTEHTITKKSVRFNPIKLAETFPEVVSYDKENNPQVDYISLIPYLVEAIDKQQKDLDKLRNLIEDLDN